MNRHSLKERLDVAKETLDPTQPTHCILWEDPKTGKIRRKTPHPNWLACAIAGGILPPVEAYMRDQEVLDAYEAENGSLEGFDWREQGGAAHPYAPPIGPMTEVEAINYLIRKEIPPSVWRDYRGNREVLRIVPLESIPADRSFRDFWSLTNEH